MPSLTPGTAVVSPPLPDLGPLARLAGTDANRCLAALVALGLHRAYGQDRLLVGVADPGAAAVAVAELAVDPATPAGAAVAAAARSFRPAAAGEHLDALVAGAADVPDGVTLSLRVTPPAAPGGGLELSAAVSSYDEAHLGVLGWHLAALAADVLRRPDAPVAELDIVTARERDLIQRRNQTDQPFPDVCVHELVSAVAARQPDAVAVVDGERQVTFAELEGMANAFARRLRGLGVGRGDRVGLMPERGTALVAAMVGVLRSGAAVVPLSPRYPGERVRQIVAEADVRVLAVGRPEFLAAIGLDADGPAGLVAVDLSDPAAWAESAAPVESVNVPSDHAAVIYTSGTTGRPKGVKVRHDTIVNYGEFNHQLWPISPTDVITQFAPFTFSTAILEITAALFAGARLVAVTDAQIADPRAFVGVMMATGVTLVLAPPEYAAYLVPTPALRVVETGASVCRPEVSAKFAGAVRHANAYGLTECSVPLVWSGTDGPTPARIPIGRPVPNTQVRVVRGGEECGLYMPGEICVSGLAVADGYIALAPGEVERFVPNPFGSGRLLRTGDIGQWNADGDIEYLGRADDQIQIRGQRVELGEVERAVAAHGLVGQAAAIAREDARGDIEIIAFVTAETTLDQAALRRDLAAVMVPYMVPARFVQLPQMPLTANGKPDKRALAAVPLDDAAVPDGPADAAERLLTAVFSEVLGHPVGVDEDFFEAGGHSLRAVRVINLVEERTGVRLPIQALFTAPTARALAARLGAGDGAYEPIASAGGPGEYLMTSAQRRLFVLDQMDAAGIAYNIPAAVELRGDLDVGRVRAAYQALVARHEALRTAFAMVDGVGYQRVAAHAPAEVDVWDVPDVGPDAREQLAARFVRPFDLGAAPLARVVVARAPGGQNLLLFDMHHIVCDGTSMKVILEEFSTLYEGGELPAEPVQYKDYGAWSAGRDLTAAQAYWTSRFAGGGADIAVVPPDWPRPPEPVFAGAACHTVLPAALRQAVEALAARLGATAYMVLLAGLMALLAKYGRNPDVAVGSPISTRTHRDTERTVGLFVNTLVMAAEAKPELSFADFCGIVREVVLGALEHREYPFEDLVNEVVARRDLTRNPLFDVCLTVQNFEDARAQLTGVDLDEIPVAAPVAKFDLSLTVTAGQDGTYLLDTEYSTDLYRADTAEWFARHFQNLLAAATRDPAAALGDLDIRDQAEQALVAGFNRLDPPAGADADFVGQVVARAHDDPDAVALVGAGRTVTRGQVAARAAQIAAQLRRCGVGPGQMVVVCADRRPELVEALFGVLQAGGAYVPIDPDHPAARVEAVLADCAPRAILLAGAALPGGLPPGVPVIDVVALGAPDSPAAAAAAADGPFDGPDAAPGGGAGPDDPAYVLFTSGTTGKPKGVVVSRRNVTHFLAGALPDEVVATPEPVVSLIANYCFDAAVLQLWAALTRGWTVAIADEADLAGPAAFDAFVRRHGVGVVDATPTQIEHYSADPDSRSWVRGVTFWFGGELLGGALVERLAAAGAALVVNQYGPTETTVAVTYEVVSDPGDVTIGRPMAGSQVYVVDDGQLAGIGLPGELWVAGGNVGIGYLKDADLTAARFMPNPFGPGRVYRTGDLGVWRADGRLDCHGRLDNQVKLRGQRLELDEVKAVLARADGVGEVAVVVVGDGTEARLAAYYTSAAGVAPETVLAYARTRLPRYMVPADLVSVPTIPRTSTGKLDTRALAAAAAPAASLAPRDSLEACLAELFAEALGVAAVGVDDDFFASGGHSLRAAALAGRIGTAVGVPVTLREVFAHPTVAELAELVRSRRPDDGPGTPSADAAGLAALPRVGGPGVHPMSSAQRRLFALDHVDQAGVAYNQPAVYEVDGPLDAGRLAAAFAQLIDRHEALRTALRVDDTGAPVQVVAAPGEVAAELELVETGRLEPADYPRLADEFVRSFDLTRAPLARLRLVRGPAGRHLVMADTHHAAVDGTSLDILVDELSALYAGRPLPAPRLGFTDWSAYLAGRDATADRAYWTRQLADAGPPGALPADSPRPARQHFDGDAVVRQWPPRLRQAAVASARRQGAAEAAVHLAAVAAVLGRYGRTEDLTLGTVTSGRTHPDAATVVGMCAATTPLRLRPRGDETFAALVSQAQEALLGAWEHQDFGFEDIVEVVGAPRDASRNPLFDVCVVFQNSELGNPDFGGLAVRRVGLPHRVAKFDLTLNVTPRAAGGYEVEAEYSAALFRRASVARALDHLEVFLERALQSPETRLDDLSMVDDAERARLVGPMAGTAAPWRPVSIPELFAAQARRHPTAAAVVADGRSTTYAELERASGALAAELASRGVGRGDYVAVGLPRGLDALAAMLGISRAGAAWVPLDPAHPAARIAEIVRDCAAKAVVTRGGAVCVDGVAAVDLDDVGPADPAVLAGLPWPAPDDLAYCLYTSGSTGRPKGVQVRHRGVANFVQTVFQDRWGIGPGDQVLVFSNFVFDGSVWE
ncbi:MAG: amino acid adenylation domain-containing protein, partial [Propionibacteriaceae bacterium]|nr:amino acid adenylation domain-containing protein [Propionibacteriaceae bacterium]